MVDVVDLFSSLVFLDYISPINICWKAGLVVLNSLNSFLSEKLFISPSILNEILARYCNLHCRFFFPFQYFKYILSFPLTCRVSAERSAVNRMGFPLYVTYCFLLAAFNILSLCLVFVSLISMCLGVFLLGCILYRTLCLLDMIYDFPFHVGEIFNYNLFKNFLIPFLFFPFFWDSYNSIVGCLILSQRSLRLLSVLFILFYFNLLFVNYFHHFIFQLTDSFFRFRYSAIDSF